MLRPSTVAGLLTLALTGASAASDAQTAGSDPAARGLDVFLHLPPLAAPLSRVPVQVEAYGFPTAVTLAPLGGAQIEAAWDPEHLGPGITHAPPAVRAVADAAGRAHLEVPVPDGDARELTLLVGISSGSHQRTRTVKVNRGPARQVALHVADTRVVPGSSVSAWVFVTSAATGAPAASSPVELELIEGGLPRTSVKLTTDLAGTAMARVPIPLVEEASWSWTLRARSLGSGEHDEGMGEVKLTPREETPGAPKLSVWTPSGPVLAGARADFDVRVRDAGDMPVVGAPVRWWAGPKGTAAPKDEEWEKLSQLAHTNAAGELRVSVDAPKLVARGAGTTLTLVARTSVEGHALAQSTTISVGAPAATVELSPEAGSIVPGVEQRLLLRVRDGRGEPVSAGFAVEGDGLAASVSTNKDGEAELTWRPPVDVGAHRGVGPCAGGVAAAVVVRANGEVPALLGRREPFELCLSVDREATALVRADRPLARSGDRLRVRVLEAPEKSARGATREGPKRAWSVLLRSSRGDQSTSVWMEDGDRGAEIEVPPGEPGAWSLSAAAPLAQGAARLAAGAVMITPRVLPRLTAKLGGGRAAPGGKVWIDADLADEKGQGMPGTVAAVLVDLHGGGSTAGLDMLDTRRSICGGLGVDHERCDRFVEGDPALDGLRRGALGAQAKKPLAPARDPGGSARDELSRTFGEVLRSLEGAVFEATRSADQLRDVRRRGPRGYTWNPELLTLVTAAMDPPPSTPGGEKLSLADLLSVDAQVTFDNVARRVTRLKLFRVLAAVRSYRHEQKLDLDEPVLRDPNALLRKLVRDGKINDDLLLDPWGGTLRFVPAAGPGLPFISVVRGFELHSPGPDGVPGNGDDVKDPFERVLRSGTAYARAVQEDRLVDARLDMEVGEATVTAWQSLLEQLTGTTLGNAGGLGLIGHGEGGGGMGFGSGHGRLGGLHRASRGIVRGVHWWSPPVRTDAKGHVRFEVPLGDAETTWRVALVGVPDGARQATTTVDVPVVLPLSARVDTGASWIEGDRVEAAIVLRNRTAKPIQASLAIAASGAAQLASAGDAARTASVPAGGAATVRVPIVAGAAGSGELAVTVSAPDLPADVVRHAWEVKPAGEPTDLTRAQWVDGRATLAVSTGAEEERAPGRPPMKLVGQPRLVLERGLAGTLAGALESLNPDRLGSRAALLDALEVAVRVRTWATSIGGDGSPLALRAREIERRAIGRVTAFARGGGSSEWLVKTRLAEWRPKEKNEKGKRPECPPSERDDEPLAIMDAEPSPESGAALACWDATVSSTMEQVDGGGDPVALARAFLAVADRSHRGSLAAAIIDRLREKVALRPSGAITLPEAEARSRAARALVYAALLRGVELGDTHKPNMAKADRLRAWVLVQRDADGGYGSSSATRAVVRALARLSPADEQPSKVIVKGPQGSRSVEVAPGARLEVPLDPAATSVAIEVVGPPLLARLERPVIRPWSRAPEAAESPLALDVAWPAGARAGQVARLSISVRHTRGRAIKADLHVPLPPGASLAEPVAGVRQVQGVLLIRRGLDASGLPVQLELPLRFGLAGKVTVPEARAVIAHEESPRALAVARPLLIQ